MSTKNSNSINVPQAEKAMEQFKMQAANEVGVNLKDGYNGDLTSREAGSVGGQMVKKMCPMGPLRFVRKSRISEGYKQEVGYIAQVMV